MSFLLDSTVPPNRTHARLFHTQDAHEHDAAKVPAAGGRVLTKEEEAKLKEILARQAEYHASKVGQRLRIFKKMDRLNLRFTESELAGRIRPQQPKLQQPKQQQPKQQQQQQQQQQQLVAALERVLLSDTEAK